MGSVRRPRAGGLWTRHRCGPLDLDVRVALRVAGASESGMPLLALEEVHGPSAAGARGSAFGEDPFVARQELSVAHKADVPLGAMGMTVFVEGGGIARGADNVRFVAQIHKGKPGSFIRDNPCLAPDPRGGGSLRPFSPRIWSGNP